VVKKNEQKTAGKKKPSAERSGGTREKGKRKKQGGGWFHSRAQVKNRPDIGRGTAEKQGVKEKKKKKVQKAPKPELAGKGACRQKKNPGVVPGLGHVKKD